MDALFALAQVADTSLLSTEGFVARTQCGPGWSGWLISVHEISNVIIFLCYFFIPVGVIGLYRRLKDGKTIAHLNVGITLTLGFIFTCGLTHLMDRMMFQWPVYRLSGLVLASCAAFSVATVAWMFYVLGFSDGGRRETASSN